MGLEERGSHCQHCNRICFSSSTYKAIKLSLNINYVFVCVSVDGFVCLCSACDGQKRAEDPLELELQQPVVSLLVEALGTELESYGRAVYTLSP